MAGIENIKNITMPLGERLAKIDANIASVRLDKNKFFDLIVDAGYVKEDGSADVKKFNRAAKRAGIDVSDRSPRNLQRITKFLNEKFDYLDNGQEYDLNVSIAGRVLAKRVMGKIAFFTISDQEGQIQLYLDQRIINLNLEISICSIKLTIIR